MVKKLGASVVTLQFVPHMGQKPDIIDYCLVSTLNLPLIQKYEVVKSVPKDPHYGVRDHAQHRF